MAHTGGMTTESGPRPTRAALVGSAISAAFGAMWAAWGAGGLPAGRLAVTVVGIALGAAVVAAAVAVRGRVPSARGVPADQGGSFFSARGYRITVVLEVVAIVAGNAALGATGLGAYVIAWTALVVGVHFVAFGRMFAGFFHVVGGALVVAAAAGAAAGLAGGGPDAVQAVTGLLSAAVLLVAGAWGIRRAVTA